ncbi:MAG: DPP IV N-terminal domain-containing protein, partial [Anaerolineae bacterium]|nr:DPP IV N-terminal domain-containing protein [Anaerolineae bacterium]
MKINLFSKLQIKVTRLMPLLLVSLSLLLQACTAPGVKDEPGLIAFLMEESFLVGHIYLMKADGSTPYPLNTGLKEDGCPVWSADGSKLLFISDNDPTEVYSANQNLYIVDINNGNLTRISNNELIYSTASFSPDGKQIVFSATSDSTKYHFQNIYLMNIDGSDIVKITDAPPIFFYPVWSPIENYILVIANYIDVDSSLYNILLLNPDGEV